MTLDQQAARTIALNEGARLARRQWILLMGASVIEALFIGAFLLLADFSNRLHVLLFLSTMTIYTLLGIGLIVLGMRMHSGFRSVVGAIDAGRER